MSFHFLATKTNKFYIVFVILLILYDSCNTQSMGFVDVFNGGAYMLRFSLTYAISGTDTTRTTAAYPYNQSKSIVTPVGATNLRLKVEHMVFIGVWHEIYSNTLTSTNKCFAFYGTVFNTYFSPISC